MWLFIQFSKNYTKEVEVAVEYMDIPEGMIFNEESDQTLRMVLNGNGFRLLGHNWRRSVLKFNIEDGIVSGNDAYYFHIDNTFSTVKNKLDFKGRILSVQKDTLMLKLDRNQEKKIPVRITDNILYAGGYGSDKGVLVSPDSVTISGPSYLVDTIQYISTEKLSLEGLNSDYSEEINIDDNGLPSNTSIFPKQVTANILVSKFTEGSHKIPITIQNTPEKAEIKIFPKEVTVVYRVGLDMYNDISHRDFVVIADYAKASEESSYLTLELVRKPEFVRDVRLQEKQVQFVILKQEQ
ncbi:CdaR family protein [Aquimarina pacifica]|uniref:CdaR family protein n=1 Tax=Aquimarina pacifica TaxID=1296415 RepID=UPI00047275EA|nr:CdaR family protein [Aquimarina pacifica]